MSYTMEDFRRDYTREHLKDLTPEELWAALFPDERLQGLSLEERLWRSLGERAERYLTLLGNLWQGGERPVWRD